MTSETCLHRSSRRTRCQCVSLQCPSRTKCCGFGRQWRPVLTGHLSSQLKNHWNIVIYELSGDAAQMLRIPDNTRLRSQCWLLAPVCKIRFFAIFVVTVCASCGHHVGRINDLILIFRLRCFIDRHAGVSQSLNEF